MIRRDPILASMGALAVLAVVAAVWFGWSWWRAAHSTTALRASDRDSVLQAASDALVALNTVDYHDPERAVDKWIQVTTGRLGTNLKDDRQVQISRTTSTKTVAEATLEQAAVANLDETAGQARVIAVLALKVSTNAAPVAPQRSRLDAILTRTEQGWKVSSVQAAS